MNKLDILDTVHIKDKIYTIRGVQIILDRDLATLYKIETKVFNQAVKRNIPRFPQKFRFQLTEDEYDNLRSQIVTSSVKPQFESINLDKKHGGRRYLPYVFTEFGVSMLSAVLKSDIAIEISIKIIESFVDMRKVINANTLMHQRFERIENRLFRHDENFEKYNSQYPEIEIKKFDLSHDRFLIIDEKEVYHLGASIKDLGKKWFAFSKMDINSFEIIGKLK